MTQPPRLHLFQAFGVELEYMIVDRDSFDVKPIADELLKAELGEYGSDFENGIVTWSNELVVHVIEMKSTRPESNFPELNTAFADVTTRRKHLYVDTFSPLLNHEQWRPDLAANGGTPGQAGYGLMAWLVLHRGWFQWLGMDTPE